MVEPNPLLTWLIIFLHKNHCHNNMWYVELNARSLTENSTFHIYTSYALIDIRNCIFSTTRTLLI